MKLTPAAANLLVEAGDRADRARRIEKLVDMRLCLASDSKELQKLIAALAKENER